MKNNLDIEKVINDYKESLPPVSHSTDEETTLINSILSKTNSRTNSNKKNSSEYSFGKVLEYVRELFLLGDIRYSVGLTVLVAGVSIFLIYNYSIKKDDSFTNTIVNKQPDHNDLSEPQQPRSIYQIDTTLLASIDCDAYRRSGESSIDQKIIFGIIGKQLKKLNIEYQITTNLITQPLNTDSSIVIVIFTYDQAKKSVEITSVSQKTDIANSKPININMLINEIKTTLLLKVRMLYE